MSDLPAFWHHNRFDPVFWVCAVGAVVSLWVLVAIPFLFMAFAPEPDLVVPCPASWHDARCTEVMDHAGR